MNDVNNKIHPKGKIIPKTGFDIGWDWHAYRLNPPDTAKDLHDFMEGFNAAKAAKVSELEHDRFTRKVLMLRYNAWKRGRMFSEDVSPAFLKTIDNGTCPVSRVDLTHGTITENDWSVDRINNNGAYVPGNLVILSTKVNKCKDNKTFKDIWELAYGGNPLDQVIDGLTVYEWRRLALITSCVTSEDELDEDGEVIFGYAIAPAIFSIPKNIAINTSIIMQTELALAAVGQPTKMYEKLMGSIRKPLRKDFNSLKNGLHKEIFRCSLRTPNDVWNTVRLFRDFYEIYTALTVEERHGIIRPFVAQQKNVDIKITPGGMAWGLQNKGYV